MGRPTDETGVEVLGRVSRDPLRRPNMQRRRGDVPTLDNLTSVTGDVSAEMTAESDGQTAIQPTEESDAVRAEETSRVDVAAPENADRVAQNGHHEAAAASPEQAAPEAVQREAQPEPVASDPVAAEVVAEPVATQPVAEEL